MVNGNQYRLKCHYLIKDVEMDTLAQNKMGLLNLHKYKSGKSKFISEYYN